MQFARILSIVSGLALLTFAGFALGFYAGVTRNAVYDLALEAWDGFAELVLDPPREAPFLQPARGPGGGVTVNEVGEDGKLVLLSGFFDGGNQIRLIRRDGTVVNRWPLSYSAIFPDSSHAAFPPSDDWHVDTHGALIEPDGAVVFNFEYAGLAKLDRCGRVLWTVPEMTHHSIERASAGGYWVPSREVLAAGEGEAFPPFTDDGRGTQVDEVLRVEAGRVVERISVPRLLYDNGLRPLLTANGATIIERPMAREPEIVHLNDIEELSAEMAAAFPAFTAGDLMLSLRDYNLVLVFDPGSETVRWHRVGPWERQHDPDFQPDGTITVFNNAKFRITPEAEATGSTIIRADPASGEATVIWGEAPGQALGTAIRGKHQALPDGGLLITEFEGGRVFQTDAAGRIVWEFVNRHDDRHVAEISQGELIPAAHFAVSDWTCNAP